MFKPGVEQVEDLLELGYRHFGFFHFRPSCRSCQRCIPIRIIVDSFTPSRSARRVLRINNDLDVRLATPGSLIEAYQLYKQHKQRFDETGAESLEQYLGSFFSPHPTVNHLSIYTQNSLVAVLHLDITPRLGSAIYCYWNIAYSHRSLGTFSILSALRLAKERGLQYLYLGYLIAENRHMAYKARFRPSEIRTAQGWVPYRNERGSLVGTEAFEEGFCSRVLPAYRPV